MSKTPFKLAAVLLFVLFAASCSNGAPGLRGGDGDGSEGLSVWIIPDEPTTSDELLAVVSGVAGEVYYRWEVNGREAEAGASERFGPVGLFPGDTVTVTVGSGGRVATDGVMMRNSPPKVTGLVVFPDPPRAGADVTATPTAVDADGDHVRFGYTWLVNGVEEPSAAGPVLPGGTFKRGDEISVRVTPTDGVAFGPTRSATLTVPNAAPEFTSTPEFSFKGRLYTYRPRAMDPDGDVLEYLLVDGPDGMELSPDGLLTWRPGPGDEGVHRVELAATDGFGQRAHQDYEITIGFARR